MNRWLQLVALLMFAGVLMPAWGSAPLEILELRGRINDFAEVLSEGQRRQLHQLSAQHHFNNKQFLVLVTSLGHGELDAETFSWKVWQQWSYSDKANAVMLVLFKEPKEAKIMVGNALHDKLDRSTVRKIIDEALVSKLQTNDFDGAAMDGYKAIIVELAR